jgi:hypothetical protein
MRTRIAACWAVSRRARRLSRCATAAAAPTLWPESSIRALEMPGAYMNVPRRIRGMDGQLRLWTRPGRVAPGR